MIRYNYNIIQCMSYSMYEFQSDSYHIYTIYYIYLGTYLAIPTIKM